MQKTTNTFAVVHGINDFCLETHPIPNVGESDVLIRLSCVGLCGTDISLTYKGMLGDSKVKYPVGVGHEACGVVVAFGNKVNNFKKGDRVTVEPSNPCRSCQFCYTNKYNVCDQSAFHSDVTIYPGMLGQYYVSKEEFVFKIPDNVTDEEAAMIEPLAVAVHACRRADVKLGTTVLITGAGPIGLLCLATAKAMGATNILVTDIKANRLETAKKMGATYTLVVGEGKTEDEAKKVKELMGILPEVTLECSGTAPAMTFAIYATRARGAIVSVGLIPAEITLPLFNALIKEIDIKGVYRYLDCFPPAIEMVAKGLVNLKPMVTHRFKFNEFKKAFEMFKTGQDGAIKCIISCKE